MKPVECLAKEVSGLAHLHAYRRERLELPARCDQSGRDTLAYSRSRLRTGKHDRWSPVMGHPGPFRVGAAFDHPVVKVMLALNSYA
jgi:hypothetical protein